MYLFGWGGSNLLYGTVEVCASGKSRNLGLLKGVYCECSKFHTYSFKLMLQSRLSSITTFFPLQKLERLPATSGPFIPPKTIAIILHFDTTNPARTSTFISETGVKTSPIYLCGSRHFATGHQVSVQGEREEIHGK